MLSHALRYAELGWPVFPLHSVQEGQCTCPAANCSSPGKHPRTEHGFKDATTDPDTIKGWWTKWPGANIGVRTGPESGLWALDIDDGKNGYETLRWLEKENEPLPNTLVQKTGGGGEHRFFRYPKDRRIPTKQGVAEGIDVRGAEGYVVVASSLHASGTRYEWTSDPGNQELAEAPDWLLDLVDPPRRTPRTAFINQSGLTSDEEERLRSALRHIDPDPYDPWIKIGMALKHADAGPRAYDLWAEWSRPSPKFDAAVQAKRWESFGPHDNPVTLGTVYEMAKQGGWTPPSFVPSFLRGHEHAGDRRRDGSPLRRVLPFRPFPVDALPGPVAEFIWTVARAIGCDPSYVALPVLSVAAAAIGSARSICPKEGWIEPCIVWTAIVGDSGTKKSPPLAIVTEPLRSLQASFLEEYLHEHEDFERQKLCYEMNLAEWKKQKKPGAPPPTKPEEPHARRSLVNDTTIEALAVVLQHNPRGVLLFRDELSGWISSFDKYRSGRGGDAQTWLELFGGKSFTIDRKSGEPKVIHVRTPRVSITGGVQPSILAITLGFVHKENGLAARLLLAMPPKQRKRWTDDVLPEHVAQDWTNLLQKLHALKPRSEPGGDDRPQVLGFTHEGKQALVEYYDRHAARQEPASGDIAAALSKLEGYGARLALVIHCLRQVIGGADAPRDPDRVDEASVRAAACLVDWFSDEAERVYAVLVETDAQRNKRRHEETIQNALRDNPAGLTRTDISELLHRNVAAEDIQAALQSLKAQGFVTSQIEKTPGRPAERWMLTKNERTKEAGDS